MDLLNSNGVTFSALLVTIVSALLLLIIWLLLKMIAWGKSMSKGAYLFLAFFPLISLMPIPPPTYENVQEAKQEHRKRKEDSGNPPDEEI
ncbi:hypothetical protein ACOBV9_16460 [Pseudoalteromonas espejiana]